MTVHYRRRFVAGDVAVTDRHTLTGLIVPWEQPSPVADERDDGPPDRYVEVFTRGAFDAQLARRDTVPTIELRLRHGGDPVGYALELADDPAGLSGEFRIRPSAWDDVATMIADGITGLSAEFQPTTRPRFQPGNVRRRDRAHLVAVALEPVAAYADARVLALRAAAGAEVDALDEHAAAAAAAADRVDRWRQRLDPLTGAAWRHTPTRSTEGT